MKFLFNLLLFFLLVTCGNNKIVYWCGDHKCISKKERSAYFKKNMTVEVKEIKNKNGEKIMRSEKILKQTKLEEKRRFKEEKELSKEIRQEEKRRIKEEKELAKEIRLEEKRRIKEEKELAKEIRLEEKRRIKKEKRLTEKVKLEEKELNKKTKSAVEEKVVKIDNSNAINQAKLDVSKDQFNELKKKIIEENLLRPFPNINDIPK